MGFVAALGVMLALHIYIGVRLLPGELGVVAWCGWVVLLGLFVLLPLRILFHRSLSRRVEHWLTWPVYVWLGLFFLLSVSLGVADATLAFRSAFIGGDPGLAPREWHWSAASVGLLAATYAWFRARGPLRVVDVEVELERLPRSHDGMLLVQLTDVHIGPSLRAPFLRRVVERVNDLEPDLVVITGDLVDGPVEVLADEVEPLRLIRARHGVFFVTGNHEYYAGAEAWCKHLESLGLQALRNRRVPIVVEGEAFDLAGVDDLASRHFGGGMKLEQALEGRDPEREVVLLAHQPRVVEEASRRDVGLQLSGHTHGGQIWPFHYLVRLQQPYNAGLFRHGKTQLYVSRGTGYWGPPFRLGAPPEITKIHLRRASFPSPDGWEPM